MSKAKAFNEGVASGLKVSQKLYEQNLEVMNYLKSKIDLIVEGHDEMKSAVDKLIEDANENAIAKIFGICNPVRPNEIKEHEQKILINILSTLCASHMNESQKKYFNNLRHHLNIEGYEPERNYDFRNIKNIDSVTSIITIAKAVRIYLYLEETNMNGIYKYEDELFEYFQIRPESFAEIDAMIESVYCIFGVDGLIEFYGDFEAASEIEDRNLSFMDVEEKDYVEISNECAQIYFKDCYFYDENKAYVESKSYVVFNAGKSINCIHKSTGIQKSVLENVEMTGKDIRNGKIVSYQDMVYYVVNNDLFFVNLDTLGSGKICHIDERKNDQGEIYDVCGLMIYKGKKIIYKNGYRYFIMDFDQGKESVHEIDLWTIESRKLFMSGDHLYFIAMGTDLLDNRKDKGIKVSYLLKRYGILNGHETNVSKAFGKRDMMDSLRALYELEVEGIFAKKYCCVFGYQGIGSTERSGYDCFYFNIDGSDDEPHHLDLPSLTITNPHIFQIELYKNYLIYVNADKKYSIVRHDFIENKKDVLIRNYGKSEKSSVLDRLTMGSSHFMKPLKYMRLGKWLWIKEDGMFTPKIIPIC